jgi:superfamily II DNA or RNA helicase
MQIYPYQQECLDAIEFARQAGKKKALVVMATGLGKTVVSALELKRLLTEALGRVLYVTNQNEILRQARHTYESILTTKMAYGYFHGEEKHLHKVDVLFASFQTMVTSRELFARDEFKYIVVDEAHHVHAETYRPTVEYFQPDFMIGLTATPNRADRKDITELMGEPVFHLDLFEALADRHLTPINYRLMTDELQNLEVLDTPTGKLSIAELNRTIFVPKRDEEIVRIIEEKLAEIDNPRTILFCSSVAHAERLAELMPYAQVLHSKVKKDQRERRIKAFRSGHSHIMITVDMFNEGIDIPEANVIVFLRSTASETIYLQQLGRGLRRAPGKAEVLVLDFVANCERIEMMQHLQDGVTNAIQGGVNTDSSGGASTIRNVLTVSVDGAEFDERLVDLINLVNRVRQSRSFKWTKENLTEGLLAFARELGRTPSVSEVDNNPKLPNRKTFEWVFKKRWNKIVEDIGLTPIRQHTYTKEELTEQILTFTKELGRTPTREDVRRNSSMANPKAFLNAFGGSWTGMLEIHGLEANTRNTPYSKEELTRQFMTLARQINKIPTATDISKASSTASPGAFSSTFKKPWSAIREELGSQFSQSRNN